MVVAAAKMKGRIKNPEDINNYRSSVHLEFYFGLRLGLGFPAIVCQSDEPVSETETDSCKVQEKKKKKKPVLVADSIILRRIHSRTTERGSFNLHSSAPMPIWPWCGYSVVLGS